MPLIVFVVVAETNEGKLEWVDPSKIKSLNVFDDMRAIIDEVVNSDSQMFTGVSKFEGFKLLDIKLTAIS